MRMAWKKAQKTVGNGTAGEDGVGVMNSGEGEAMHGAHGVRETRQDRWDSRMRHCSADQDQRERRSGAPQTRRKRAQQWMAIAGVEWAVCGRRRVRAASSSAQKVTRASEIIAPTARRKRPRRADAAAERRSPKAGQICETVGWWG